MRSKGEAKKGLNSINKNPYFVFVEAKDDTMQNESKQF